MSKERRLELISCGGLLLVSLIWGVAFVVVKNALDYVPVMYLLAFRFSVGAVVLALIFARRLVNVSISLIKHSALIGMSLFVAYAFQTYGCNYTTAGKNAFLTPIYMIVVPFLNWIFTKKKPDIKCLVAAVIAFWGIGLISLTDRFTLEIGDSLTLICGFFFALQIVLIAIYAQEDDPVLLAVGQLVFAALYSWICAPFVCGPITSDMFNSDSIFGILFLGVMSTAVCGLLQTVCQKYAPPAPVAIIMSMESLFGALSAFIFLSEVMTGRMIWGCVLMLIAMLMIELNVSNLFYPDEYIDSSYNIDYSKLYDEGYRGIIYDIDNTLVEHGAPANEQAIELLTELDKMGFKILFLSNNKEPRVKNFRDVALPTAQYIYKGGKPSKKGYVEAMKKMGTNADNTIFIGDQLFTDVWGAKRCKIRNILVKPIDKKEEIQIILKRKLEWIVLQSYARTPKSLEKPHELVKK